MRLLIRPAAGRPVGLYRRAAPALRGLRAAVFAALCVTLAATAHRLAGHPPPAGWVAASGFTAVIALAMPMCGQERSLREICGAMAMTQIGLHLLFNTSAARASVPPMTDHQDAARMFAAHLAAAMVAAWWLRCGEAAVWSLLRQAATLLPRPRLRWPEVTAPDGQSPQACFRRCEEHEQQTRRLLLRHSVTRRGPPANRGPAAPALPNPNPHGSTRHAIAAATFRRGLGWPHSSPMESRMHATPTASPRALHRALMVGALTAVGLLTSAGAAFAHVTIHPDSYPQGATDGTITFRVPNEEDNAGTVKVDVVFPTDHPIPSVLVQPPTGWTAQTKTTTLRTPIKTDDGDITTAVSEIIWTGGKIAPGQYQDFTVAFGQLPTGTNQLVFKALQTYSDGKTVRWIEQQQPGQPEPEDPAPTLKLATASDTSRATVASSPVKASDSTARTLGIAGLIVGALGLLVGGLGVARARASRH